MVEINRNKILCSALLSSLAIFAVFAGEVPPRIAELGGNEGYMELLQREQAMANREDSIAVVMENMRASFNSDSPEASQNREKIIELEGLLFDIRAKKSRLVDSINIIEQEWVFSHLNQQPSQGSLTTTPQVTNTKVDNATFIFLSNYVKDNLPQVDYLNLVKSEEIEAKLGSYTDQYLINYQELLSLKQSYEQTQDEAEAQKIAERFHALNNANNTIAKKLSEGWDFVYDNKNFAYSMLMELKGNQDILLDEQERARKSQETIAKLQMDGLSDPTLNYLVEKQALTEYELVISDKLSLKMANDSLKTVLTTYGNSLIEYHSPISIEERLFMVFEPIKASSKSHYASANSIPETAIYERGTIYRIAVGNFAKKQNPSIFRGVYPVSYIKEPNNRYSYYLGGYSSLPEAEEAQRKMKEHGFRRPEVVRWQDGERRNLADDPIETSVSYRIEISGVELFSDEMKREVGEYVNSISKVGNKFVIAPLFELSSAEMIESKLKSIDPELQFTISELEPVENNTVEPKQ